MPRSQRPTNQFRLLVDMLTAAGPSAPPDEQKIRHLQAIRQQSEEAGGQVDLYLLEQIVQLRQGLTEARQTQEQLRGILERLSAPPLYPAAFLKRFDSSRGSRALVSHGNSWRVVAIAEEVDPECLEVGDQVLLNNELNVLLEKASFRGIECGETAVFERYASENRMVLKSRDEDLVAYVGASLRDVPLRNGDLVRWDRSAWLAFEKVDRSAESHLFLEETPAETFDDIGGLDAEIRQLLTIIELHYVHPDRVESYHVKPKRAAILSGPPGTGKTLMARAFANWLATMRGSGRSRFMVIKPGALNCMWYGQSEANVREAFRVAREVGASDPKVPLVMFWDEIDSIGSARTDSAIHHVDNKILNTLMTELDGMTSRGNVLVVAATNRLDVLDEALVRPGRLGDLKIRVPRPDMRAAREIFGKYLRPDMPYATNGNGHDPAAVREQIIDAAVSRIYAPNGDGDLAMMTFRDGKQRRVCARDLVSGAVIANIILTAAERACLRDVQTHEVGVRLEDVLSAVAEEFETAVRSLTPANCRKHISGLPDDVDVVRVEPVRRNAVRQHKYLNLLAA